MNPLEKSGFVLCDDKYHRLKIMNSKYVRLKWLGELNSNYNEFNQYILVSVILSDKA